MKNCSLGTIESEIHRENAEALGRAWERLELALLELEVLRQKVVCDLAVVRKSADERERGHSIEVQEALVGYARRYERARGLRHALIIQREAVGLRRHEDVDRQYPLPGPLTPRAAFRLVDDR